MLSTANRRPPPSALNLEAAKAKYVPRTFDKHRMPLPLKPTQVLRRQPPSPSSSEDPSLALAVASTQRTSAASVLKEDLEHERISHTAAVLGAAAAVPDTADRLQAPRRAVSSSLDPSMQARGKDVLEDVYAACAATIVTAVRVAYPTTAVSARAAGPARPTLVKPKARRPQLQPSIDDVPSLDIVSAPIAKPRRSSSDSTRSSFSSDRSDSASSSSRYSSASEAAPQPSLGIKTHTINRADVTPIGARAAEERASCDSTSTRSASSSGSDSDSDSGFESEASYYSKPSAHPQVSGAAASLFSALPTGIPARPIVSLTPFMAVTPYPQGLGDSDAKDDFWEPSLESAKSLWGIDASSATTRPTMAKLSSATHASQDACAVPIPTLTVQLAASNEGLKHPKSPASKATIPTLQQQVHMVLRDRHAVSAAIGRTRSDASRRSSIDSLSSEASSYASDYDSDSGSSEAISLPDIEFDNDHVGLARGATTKGVVADVPISCGSSDARSSCEGQGHAPSTERTLPISVTVTPLQPVPRGLATVSRPARNPARQSAVIDKPPAAARNASAYSYRTLARSTLPANIERPRLAKGSDVPLVRGDGRVDEEDDAVEQDDTIDCSRPWVWSNRSKVTTPEETTCGGLDAHRAAAVPSVPTYRFEPPPTYSRRRSSSSATRNGLPGGQNQRRAAPQLQLRGGAGLDEGSWMRSGAGAGAERYISAAMSPASMNARLDGQYAPGVNKAAEKGRLSIVLPPQPTMFGSGKGRSKVQIIGC